MQTGRGSENGGEGRTRVERGVQTGDWTTASVTGGARGSEGGSTTESGRERGHTSAAGTGPTRTSHPPPVSEAPSLTMRPSDPGMGSPSPPLQALAPPSCATSPSTTSRLPQALKAIVPLPEGGPRAHRVKACSTGTGRRAGMGTGTGTCHCCPPTPPLPCFPLFLRLPWPPIASLSGIP